MSIYPYDAVVFDLDGTLFDAEEGIVSSVKYAMQELGCAIPEKAELRNVVGPPLRDSFRNMLQVPEALVEKAMDLYREDFSTRGMYLYSVYPHIRRVLQMLSEGGVHVALATSKPRWLAVRILRYFGMMELFDCVVGEEDGQSKLGKPELIRRALPEKYSRAGMVGDRMFDVHGARANGIEAIGVAYGCGSEQELADAGADVIIGHHAHALHGMSMVRGRPCFWNIGNFVELTNIFDPNAIDAPQQQYEPQQPGIPQQSLQPQAGSENVGSVPPRRRRQA